MKKTLIRIMIFVVPILAAGIFVYMFVEQRKEGQRNKMAQEEVAPAPIDSAAAYSDTTASVGGP